MIDAEMMYRAVVDWIDTTLAINRLEMDDIAWTAARPDIIGYPVASGDSNLWGFIITICCKNGDRLTGRMIVSSLTCPIKGGWFS